MTSFPTTRWSMILAARDGSTTEARAALEELCRDYWPPIYAFVRHIGHDPDEALDLTQGYFERLLEKDFLRSVDPRAGRFRSFVLVSVKHHISHERERSRAQKRGGRAIQLSLDADEAERRYRAQAVDYETPERTFERRWAITVLDRAMERVRDGYASRGKLDEFDELKPMLTGTPEPGHYHDLAVRLAVTDSAIKVAVHRLRRRFGEALRHEVEELVASPDEVENEMREILAAL